MTEPAGNRSGYLTIWRDASTVPAAGAATGQMVETAEKLGTVWGKISSAMPPANAASVRGQKEIWESYHVNVNAMFVIVIPWTAGIAATDYFTVENRHGSVRYNIAGQPLDSGGDLIIPVAQVV